MRRPKNLLARILPLLAACLGALALAAAPERPENEPDHTNLDWIVQIELHPDLTFVETWQEDWSLNTARGVALFSHPAWSYWPDSQSFTVEEAWVTQPDGTRLDVPAANIFTRPSQAAQSAPGYVNSQTVSIEYRQLMPGSRWHVKWRLVQTKPPLAGFNAMLVPVIGAPVGHIGIDITAPEAVPLAFAARGGFATNDIREGGMRHISGRLDNMPMLPGERSMVASTDFAPLFVATTLPSLEAYGAILHRALQGSATVTPEIAALATRIRGDRTGLAAARAISDWVSGHIRYVAVYLNPNEGLVPHPAEEVLRNGFGDCKDHVALMQALLAASGVRSEPAIVEWGTRYQPLPLPLASQFDHEMIYLPEYDVFTNPTSPFSRFGELDRALAGKTVVIASAEGQVAHTPESRAADNRYDRDSDMTLLADGTITGNSHITATGGVAEAVRPVVANAESPEALVETNLAQTPEGGTGRLRSSDPRDLEAPMDIRANWISPGAVPVQAGEVYLTVPIGFDMEQPNGLRGTVAGRPRRRTPMAVGAKDLTWTTRLAIPAGLAVARLPAGRSLANAAGTFSSHYERTEQGVAVLRRLTLERDVVQPERYGELQALIYAAAADARGVVVLSPRADMTTAASASHSPP